MGFPQALALLAISITVSAPAEARINILGGATATRDYLSITGHNVTSGTGFAHSYGITLEKLVAGNTVGLEIGALYSIKEVVTVTDGFLTTETRLTFAEVPALLRVWITRGLSVGAGAYYARGISDSFNQLSLQRNDLGALGSISLVWRLAPALGFVLDGRYAQSVTSVSRSLLESHKLRTGYALGGIQISL